MYNKCTGTYKFGNNTYPRRIRCRLNLGHIFQEKKCLLWAGKYGNWYVGWMYCPISVECSESYSSALKMEADKSVNFLPDYMASCPRRSDIHSHFHETLKSYK